MTDASTLDRLGRERTEAARMLATLIDDHAGVVAASADSNADDEHDPEGSTIAFERSQLDALIDQTRTRLTEVEAALERVERGTYGTCEVCGEPIGEGRLEARPTARRCIRHA